MFVLVLASFEVDIMPFLAGAGMLGVVIGLGAQQMIHDVVSGFFILFEDIFLVGDFVEGGGARGWVEGIDFRTTRIRDAEGRLHIVRNGLFDQVINYSKEWVNALVDVPIPHKADLSQVNTVLEEAAEKLFAERDDLIEKTNFKGIVQITSGGIVLRSVTKVKPGRHVKVALRLRQIIVDGFHEHGLEFAREGYEVVIHERPGEHDHTA